MTILFGVSVYTSANPIYSYSGVDSSCFFLLGRGINNGYIPYVDLVDNKGLVLYFLNAFPQFFYPDKMSAYARVMVWLEEAIFLFVSLRIIVYISKRYGGKTGFLPQLFYLMSILPLIENGNMCEEYTNLFTLIAFLFFVKYIFDDGNKFSFKYGLVFGIVFTLSFFVRPNNAMPIAALIMVFCGGLIMKKAYKNLLLYIVSGAIGFAFVFLPIIIYLLANGALDDCIEQTVIANLGYADDSGLTIREVLFTPYGFTAICILLISLFAD
jgi:hypothetical protein